MDDFKELGRTIFDSLKHTVFPAILRWIKSFWRWFWYRAIPFIADMFYGIWQTFRYRVIPSIGNAYYRLRRFFQDHVIPFFFGIIEYFSLEHRYSYYPLLESLLGYSCMSIGIAIPFVVLDFWSLISQLVMPDIFILGILLLSGILLFPKLYNLSLSNAESAVRFVFVFFYGIGIGFLSKAAPQLIQIFGTIISVLRKQVR